MNKLFERGLPCNFDAERMVLGAIMLDSAGSVYLSASGALAPSDFGDARHSTIFSAMSELRESGQVADRVTVANRLIDSGKLDSAGGISYLVGLDDNLPRITNPDSYIGIVKEKSLLRALVVAASKAIDGALSGEETSASLAGALTRCATATEEAIGKSAGAVLASVGDAIERHGIEQLIPGDRKRGLKTGFADIDRVLSPGLLPRQLIILAARPGVGKTALAINMATSMAMRGNPVAYFSLEMGIDEILGRAACSIACVPSAALRSGKASGEQSSAVLAALSKLNECPLRVSDAAGITLRQIERECERMKAKSGLACVIVDYLGLVSRTPGERVENRTQEVSVITRGLKVMAGKLGVPVIAASQLNRGAVDAAGGAERKPELQHLRDSGSIEQDADIVLLLHRPDATPGRRTSGPPGLTEVLIAKHRNGPTGRITLRYRGEYTRFESIAQEEGGDAAA